MLHHVRVTIDDIINSLFNVPLFIKIILIQQRPPTLAKPVAPETVQFEISVACRLLVS